MHRLARIAFAVGARPSLRVWLTFLIASTVLLGCGTTGGTTRQTVHFSDLNVEQALVPVRVYSVLSASDAAILSTSGVYRWGEFDASDLANLRGSLEDTIAAATKNSRVDGSETLSVYVTVRRYVVAASNVEGAALVAIDWCLARSDGLPVYRELFYATDRMRFIGTLGMIKDSVHRAIVRRISESSLVLAGLPPPSKLPRTVAGTFDDLDGALATLPESVRSWGAPVGGFYAGGFYVPGFYLPGSESQAVPWRSAKLTESNSCPRLLEGESG